MNKKILNNLVIIFSLVALTLNAQIPDEIAVKVSATDQKRLEKAAEDFTAAQEGIKKGMELYQEIPDSDSAAMIPENQRKFIDALKLIGSSSETFKYASKSVYDVYHAGCMDFWKTQEKSNHFVTGLEKAKYMQKEAKAMLIQSELYRNKIKATGDLENAIILINKATEYEIQAMRYEGRALNIYQDFPIEYDYGWENDIDIKFVLAQKEKEKQERNDRLFGKAIEKEIEKEKIIDTVVEPPKVEAVWYRIQVAANVEPLTPENLKRIYDGDQEVDEVVEDEWYKYQFGSYNSFSVAVDVLEALNVNKAFVVAYQGVKKLSIREARKIAP